MDGWKRYEAFVTGDAIADWTLDLSGGAARIASRDCQPGSRIGIRTLPIALDGPQRALQVRFAWKGRAIHRAGMYYNTVDAADKVLRSGEILGPTGDFDETRTVPFQATGIEGTKLLLYFFHDGGGELALDDVRIEPIAPEAGKADRASDGRSIVLQAAESRPLFPAELGMLLGGERRFALGAEGPGTLFAFETRRSAIARDYRVVRDEPFWIVAPRADAPAALREVAGEGEPALAPLPADWHTYAYYWGAFRFGKKPRDLEHDTKELSWAAENGLTGLAVEDDYGLDYSRWNRGEKLDPAFLTQFAKTYAESPLRSPLVVGIYSGLDRARISLKPGQHDKYREYLALLKATLEPIEKSLAGKGLLLWPMDEPNQGERNELAKEYLPLWAEAFGAERLAVTCNWKTARDLGKSARIWIGAGDPPAHKAAADRNVAAFYWGIGADADPFVLRRLAGLHAWASGTRTQAWWHFRAFAESPKTDLDGKMPDFAATREGRNDRIEMATRFAQVREGIADLRLLLMAEDRAARDPAALEYLEALRARIPSSERADSRWDTAEEFEAVRRELARIASGK